MTSALVVAGAVVGILLRVPVAFAIAIPCLIYIALDPTLSFASAFQRMVSSLNVFPLLAVPMFVLAGNLANASGLTDRIYAFFQDAIGHIRGSLGYVNVGASFGFSWMSGTALSDVAVLGSMQVSQMQKRGYDTRYAVGITGASSLIAPIMPPSVPAIMYGVASGVSIGAMFIAGIVPALLITGVLVMSAYLYARRKPHLKLRRASLRQIAGSGLKAAPIAVAPVIILGGIFSGLFTPTEAAAAAVLFVLVIGFALYRSLNFSRLRPVLLETGVTTGTLMLIVSSASLLGWVLTRERVPQALLNLMLSISDSPVVVLLLIVAALLLIGMLLEPTSAILIFTPVLMPLAVEVGIDPLHLGVVMVFTLMIGLMTPPVGIVLFVLESVTTASFKEVAQGVLPYVVAFLALAVIFAIFPGFTTWLPQFMNT